MKPSVLFVSVLLIVPGIAAAIPNPAVVYCIEQGYEYDDGMCIFPDGSQCNVWQYYCKCEPNGTGCWPGDFNCAFPCQQLPCRQAGQLVTIGECCPQLAEIPRIEAYDEKCNLLGWLGWLFICSDCGDGICESWESVCNCPQDCAPVHNITQDTYHQTIQAAIDDAFDGDTIIVADGTYTGEGNRDIDFLGKAITVRSESGPENCIIDCNGTEDDPHRGFYFHSVEDTNSILDGLTITNGVVWRGGGGISCDGSSPTIANCIITRNTSHGFSDGAGISCRANGSSPTIINCNITYNSTGRHGEGGGIYCAANAPTISNCTIAYNYAKYGAGIACTFAQPKIKNCIITNNTSASDGGILCRIGNLAISGCIISGNRSRHGGGISISDSSLTADNCTIADNVATVYGGGMRCTIDSTATLTNCILWGNDCPQGPQILMSGGYGQRYPSHIYINYSNVQGGQADIVLALGSTANWGQGNIDADPCFVDPGYWADANDPNIIVEPNNPNAIWVEGDYHLLEGSPCIDAGDPNYIPEPNETDLDGNPRLIGGRTDMGAYEFELLPAIEAVVKISPNTLNLQSEGRWLTCYILLPQDCNAADIDPNSILLEDEIPPDKVVSYGRLAMARFSRPALQQLLSDLQTPAEVELLVSGRLTDGTTFEGTDTITLINTPGRRKQKSISTHEPPPPKPKKHRKSK